MGFGFERLWSFEVVIVFWVMFVSFGDVEFHMFFGFVNFLLEGGELLFEWVLIFFEVVFSGYVLHGLWEGDGGSKGGEI